MITCRGENRHHPIDGFLEPDFGPSLLVDLQDQNPSVQLVSLLEWPDAERYQALKFIEALRPRSIRTTVRGPAYKGLLDAVLAEMVNDTDVVRCERGRRAALEVVALCHADAIETACSRVVSRLRELGVNGILPQSLVKCARQLVLASSPSSLASPQALAGRFLAQTNVDAGVSDESALLYYRQDFYTWTGSVWLPISDDQITTRVTRWLQRERAVNNEASINSHLVRDVVVNLRGMVAIDANHLDLPLWVVSLSSQVVQQSRDFAFANGRVEYRSLLDEVPLEDIAPSPVDPRHFSTVTLPFHFDPAAECPLWQETLSGIFTRCADDDHRLDVFQEFVGWTLRPGDMRFQKFLAMKGSANNGKSLLLKIWTLLLGEANVSNIALDHFNSEFRLAEMVGKLANIAADMNYIDRVAEGQLKALTSGDRIQVNRKFKSPITLVPTAKLIFSTNDLPRFTDRSEGIWRRLIAMPFHRVFQPCEDDLNRFNRLVVELPGIFNWAVAGLRRLYQQGHFTDCGECERCKSEHRVHSDPFLQWWNTSAIADRHMAVSCDDVFQDYQEHCRRNGNKPRSSSEFGKQLLPRLRPCSGAPKRRLGDRDSRVWYYSGLRLIKWPDRNRQLPASDCRCGAVSNRCPTGRRARGRT